MLIDYAIHDAYQLGLKTYFGGAAMGYDTLSAQARMMGMDDLGRKFSASATMLGRGVKSYGKPAFNIPATKIDGVEIDVREDVVLRKSFCNLLHFARDTDRNDPKVLLVAPLSGHYATLLRGTVEALLPHHDVYITDWINARDVHAREGRFGLADYASYVVDMLDHLGPDTHVMAVCQPTVPVLAAVSLMAQNNHRAQPLSMTLMGGPVDVRAAPTSVVKFGEDHSMDYFRHNVMTMVPLPYKGFTRIVHPGFKQLTGFWMMNPERHQDSHRDMFNHLRQGDSESADRIGAFYDEYLSVMDLPGEFYLDTIEMVFQRASLAKGEMLLGNQHVDPTYIKKTAILTIEGEKDDISAPGQTVAAHKLVNGLPPEKHFHHLQAGSGHYGIFEGRRWRSEICPRVTHFIRAQAVDNGLKYSEISGDTGLIPPNLWASSGALTTPAPKP